MLQHRKKKLSSYIFSCYFGFFLLPGETYSARTLAFRIYGRFSVLETKNVHQLFWQAVTDLRLKQLKVKSLTVIKKKKTKKDINQAMNRTCNCHI